MRRDEEKFHGIRQSSVITVILLLHSYQFCCLGNRIVLVNFYICMYVRAQVLLQVHIPPRAQLPGHQAGAAVQRRRPVQPAPVRRHVLQPAHVRHDGRLRARGGGEPGDAGWPVRGRAGGPPGRLAVAGAGRTRRPGGARAPGVRLVARVRWRRRRAPAVVRRGPRDHQLRRHLRRGQGWGFVRRSGWGCSRARNRSR
jgi:hypothetical protein